MKEIINGAMIVAVCCLVFSIVARWYSFSLPPIGLTPGALLNFTNTCLLLAVAFMLYQKQ